MIDLDPEQAHWKELKYADTSTLVEHVLMLVEREEELGGLVKSVPIIAQGQGFASESVVKAVLDKLKSSPEPELPRGGHLYRLL